MPVRDKHLDAAFRKDRLDPGDQDEIIGPQNLDQPVSS